MPPNTRLPILVAVVACLAGGCSSSDSLTPSGSPSSSPALADICPEIDLRMPNGEPLNLNGRWRANDAGSYFLSQSDSCVFWIGQSAPSEESPAGAYWTNVFSGRIVSSLVIAGPWSDVPSFGGESANHGELMLGIEFFEIEGITYPALAMQRQTPERQFGEFGGTAWQPEASLSQIDSFTGTYGFDDPWCPWLDVDGQRYSLVNAPWTGRVIDLGEGRFVEEGARAHVEAQIAPALGDPRCQSSALLVWEVGAAP